MSVLPSGMKHLVEKCKFGVLGVVALLFSVAAFAQQFAGDSAVLPSGCITEVLNYRKSAFDFSAVVQYVIRVDGGGDYSPGGAFWSDCFYVPVTPDEYLKYHECFENGNCPSSSSSGDNSFDYLHAAEIFGFFFSFTVALWAFSKAVGLVIRSVKEF